MILVLCRSGGPEWMGGVKWGFNVSSTPQAEPRVRPVWVGAVR